MKKAFLRRDGSPLRIGHRGAAALAPANTLRSLEAAVDGEVDLVEFDVVARPDGTLVLGHSVRELAAEPATLDDALGFFAARTPERLGLLVDVKRPGHESVLVEALRRYGLTERAVVSSSDVRTLRAFRRLEPGLTRSRTYPRDRLGLATREPLVPVVGSALPALRRALPWRIGRMLARAGASVATLHHRLVSRAAVERCHDLGAAVFAWTVDDRAALARLDSLGVDGVITNDPRIFG